MLTAAGLAAPPFEFLSGTIGSLPAHGAVNDLSSPARGHAVSDAVRSLRMASRSCDSTASSRASQAVREAAPQPVTLMPADCSESPKWFAVQALNTWNDAKPWLSLLRFIRRQTPIESERAAAAIQGLGGFLSSFLSGCHQSGPGYGSCFTDAMSSGCRLSSLRGMRRPPRLRCLLASRPRTGGTEERSGAREWHRRR